MYRLCNFRSLFNFDLTSQGFLDSCFCRDKKKDDAILFKFFVDILNVKLKLIHAHDF